MAFRLPKGSLFAVLLRSSWWYSVLIGVAFIALSVIFANARYVALGVFSALPFLGIACYAAYRQSKQPSQKRVLEIVQQSRKMTTAEVAREIADRYSEENFESQPFKGNAADIELTRGHRKILLCTKRFKAANTGIEPLKQLVAAGELVEATEYLYVALGEVSAAAREYASQNTIEIIQVARLTAFIDGQAHID